jgi:hypothetical protein
MLNYLRDPIWQFVGVAVAIVTFFAMIALARPTLVQRWWLPGVLVALALVALMAVLRLRGPLKRAGAQVVGAANRAVRAVKTEGARLRAYHSGALEELRSELEAERHKYGSEKAKVEKLTLPLATLSDGVLRLFDRRVERPDEMEWGAALAASERALKCASAALSHHVTKIVYYDPDYPGSWVKDENAEEARDHFVGRWFVQKNAPQLASWIREALQSPLAHRSLIVFAQDIVPDTVAEVRNDTCLIRKYLDAGGRVVWRGDIPFWYQGKAGGAKDDWHGPDSSECGPWKILGVYYFNYEFKWSAPRGDVPRLWGTDLPLHITAAGRDIGLAYPRQGLDIRPAPCEDVHVSYLALRQETFRVFGSQHGSEGEFSLCWKKNFNERYPYSGFMQYVPGRFVWREVNDHFFRFAVSGWPLLFDE